MPKEKKDPEDKAKLFEGQDRNAVQMKMQFKELVKFLNVRIKLSKY